MAGLVFLHLTLQQNRKSFMMRVKTVTAILAVMMVAISLLDRRAVIHEIPQPIRIRRSQLVITLWTALALVMIGLYVFFN